MGSINIYAAWAGILSGFIAGAGIGLFFHDDNWAGGYHSWTRRMMRLGHISFFGIAFINLAFAVSVRMFDIRADLTYVSWLFIAGAVTMPLICFLSAWKKLFRHLFFIPVLCLLAGTLVFIFQGLLP